MFHDLKINLRMYYTHTIFVIITFKKVEIIVNNKGAPYTLRNECGYSVFFLLSSIVLFDMQNSDLEKKNMQKK